MAELLGTIAAAVGGTGLPVQVVSSGLPYLFVPLTTRRAVDSVTAVDAGELDAFFKRANVDAHGVFLFSPERGATRRR